MFCVKHFFNCAVFVVCLRLTVFVCCFAICLVPSPSSSCLITWFLWLFVLSHNCHKSTHWLCSALLCLLCCADPAMLMQCTLVVQHSCCCCFCPVRKAFVVVIVKLVLPTDVIVVTVAVFHQYQIKLLFLFLRLILPLSFYLNLYFVLFVCGTNCLCTRTSLFWN